MHVVDVDITVVSRDEVSKQKSAIQLGDTADQNDLDNQDTISENDSDTVDLVDDNKEEISTKSNEKNQLSIT